MKAVKTVAGMLWVSAALALASHALAFRSGADRPELSSTPRVRWDEPILYSVHQVDAEGIPAPKLLEVAAAAASTWTQPACTAAGFQALGLTATPAAPDDGVNTIQWLDADWLDRGFGQDAAGATDVLYEQDEAGQWRIIEADVYLNAELFDWSIGSNSPDLRDLRVVLTHELGHVLGLLHPCEPGAADGAPDCTSDPKFAHTTMYPLYFPEQASLADDDVQGVCFLYPVDDCEATGCPAGFACTPTGCAVECGGTVCKVGETCRAGACAPRDCGIACGCSDDDECPGTLACIDRACQPGRTPAGDPCSSDRECQSGACDEHGSCRAGCATDRDCPRGKCGHSADHPGVCEADLASFGEACATADDCRSAKCLQVGSDQPLCTRSCDPQNACPLGWVCSKVDGEDVCRAVPAPPPDEGCSVSPTPQERLPIGILVAGILAAGATARTRSRRK